jgi:hypothetical protein
MRVHINVSFVPDFDLGRNVTRGIHIHVNQITNNTGNPTIGKNLILKTVYIKLR